MSSYLPVEIKQIGKKRAKLRKLSRQAANERKYVCLQKENAAQISVA